MKKFAPLSSPTRLRQLPVEVLVSAEGVPKDVHVRRGLGFGLDEKATEAVKHYRFFPATSKGKPIEARREVMVSFAKF